MENDTTINLIAGISLCFMPSMLFHRPGKIDLLIYNKKSNILNLSKNIRLLHVAPEKCLQKILKYSSHIEYIKSLL